MSYGSWAVVGPSLEIRFLLEEITAIPGVTHDPKRGFPIYAGTLEDFADNWGKHFEVSPVGAYIRV